MSRYDSDTTRRFDQQFAETPQEYAAQKDRRELKQLREALAASQRREQELQGVVDVCRANFTHELSRAVRLQSRLDSAAAILARLEHECDGFLAIDTEELHPYFAELREALSPTDPPAGETK